MKSSGVLASLMLTVALFGAAQATDGTVTAAPTIADCTTACQQGLTNAVDVAASAEVAFACSLTGGQSQPSGGDCSTLADGPCTSAAECTNAFVAAGQAAPALTVVNCVDGNGACVDVDCVLGAAVTSADCTSSCGTLTQTVATAAVGAGAACSTLNSGNGAGTYACQPGDNDCPASVTYSWTSAVADDAVAFTCPTAAGSAGSTLTRVVACTASDASTVTDAATSCPDSGETTTVKKALVSDKTCAAVANVCSSDSTLTCTDPAIKDDTGTCATETCGAADFGAAAKACCMVALPLCSTVTVGNTCTGTAVAAASTARCAADPCVASTDFGAATTNCCQAAPAACSTLTTEDCTSPAIKDAGTKLCATATCDASDFGTATSNCCKAKAAPAPPASGAATAAVSLTALVALVLA